MGPVTYRNRGMRACGWVGVMFFTFLALTAAWGTTSIAGPIGGTFLLALFAAPAYLLAVRPRIDISDRGVHVRNPLSTLHVPWSEIGDVSIDRTTVRLHTKTHGTVWLWASTQMATSHGYAAYTDRVAATIQSGLQLARIR